MCEFAQCIFSVLPLKTTLKCFETYKTYPQRSYSRITLLLRVFLVAMQWKKIFLNTIRWSQNGLMNGYIYMKWRFAASFKYLFELWEFSDKLLPMRLRRHGHGQSSQLNTIRTLFYTLYSTCVCLELIYNVFLIEMSNAYFHFFLFFYFIWSEWVVT